MWVGGPRIHLKHQTFFLQYSTINSFYTFSAVPVNAWLVFDKINQLYLQICNYFVAPASLKDIDSCQRVTAICRPFQVVWDGVGGTKPLFYYWNCFIYV